MVSRMSRSSQRKATAGALIAAALLFAPSLPLAATAPVHYGLFGDVHVATPAGEPKRTVILVSDKDGWNARAESLANALGNDGALVFGIDYPSYLKEMLSIKNDACHFPSAHIQEMSDWMQKNQKVKNFTYPLLVGDGAGAAFAYARCNPSTRRSGTTVTARKRSRRRRNVYTSSCSAPIKAKLPAPN